MFKNRLNELTEILDKCNFSTHSEAINPQEALEMAHSYSAK